MVEVVSFRRALDLSKEFSKCHLLLGNGFSIACRGDIFSYNALFDQADFSKLTATAKKAFEMLKTRDFEVVMETLRKCSILMSLYPVKNDQIIGLMERDADGLRDLLASTIAKNHPDRPTDISLDAYRACRRFLANFSNGQIYTLNYDLLLYWAIMQDELEPSLKADDGFRASEEEPDEYVTWDVENTNPQSIHYLHGALHLYDAGIRLQKYTWSKTGIALIDQIRDALGKNMFPLIVAEGNSNDKLRKIYHSGYLTRSYRSFSQIGGALFLYGHSMAENDEHILGLIEKGKVDQLFVGIYGDPGSEENQIIIKRAERIQTSRTRHSLKVTFYDAADAHVWG